MRTSPTAATSRTTFPISTVYPLFVPTTTTTILVAARATGASGASLSSPSATVAVAGAGDAAASNTSATYIIQANDLLVRIAKRLKCSYTDIMAANNYTGDPNKFLPPVGQTITLPPTCKPTAAASTAAGETTYTVVANDTLSGIAQRNRTTVQAIAASNGWTNGTNHRINPGDVIKLPAKKA